MHFRPVACEKRRIQQLETFSSLGFVVAKLTTTMSKEIPTTLLALLFAAVASASDWSVGIGSGAFVFGDFAERTIKLATPGGSGMEQTSTLSAATRPGLSVDLQRRLTHRFSLRLEGTFTDAPLQVKTGRGEGVTIDAGRMDVTTISMPFVWHVSRGGALRFHLYIGPAYAVYDVERDPNTALVGLEGRRHRYGGIAGAGGAWAWSEHFQIEARISDTVTSSPFRFADSKTPKPHHVHTTLGVRYVF